MTKAANIIALCSAIALETGATAAPEWLHLLPAGGMATTQDGRGPYRVENYDALMSASLKEGEKLVIDENHSTDLAAPKGMPAPARGWIVALQYRADGIWGKVEWTEEGRKLVEQGAYRGISPVIAHRKDKTVVAIRRASLVNQPNLEGLTALHSEETSMDWKKKLVELLKLDEGAEDDAIVTALNAALAEDKDGIETALQSALAPIAKAAGLAESADGTAIIAGISALKEAKKPDDQIITSLQSQLADTANELKELKDERTRDKATAFVDSAIAEGRVGVKPQRDLYISMHMENPERTETLINAMAKVGGTVPAGQRPAAKGNDLDDADHSVIALMGIDPEEFKKTRAAENGIIEEAA